MWRQIQTLHLSQVSELHWCQRVSEFFLSGIWLASFIQSKPSFVDTDNILRNRVVDGIFLMERLTQWIIKKERWKIEAHDQKQLYCLNETKSHLRGVWNFWPFWPPNWLKIGWNFVGVLSILNSCSFSIKKL